MRPLLLIGLVLVLGCAPSFIYTAVPAEGIDCREDTISKVEINASYSFLGSGDTWIRFTVTNFTYSRWTATGYVGRGPSAGFLELDDVMPGEVYEHRSYIHGLADQFAIYLRDQTSGCQIERHYSARSL